MNKLTMDQIADLVTQTITTRSLAIKDISDKFISTSMTHDANCLNFSMRYNNATYFLFHLDNKLEFSYQTGSWNSDNCVSIKRVIELQQKACQLTHKFKGVLYEFAVRGFDIDEDGKMYSK